jgi:ankyrin repeat protein
MHVFADHASKGGTFVDMDILMAAQKASLPIVHFCAKEGRHQLLQRVLDFWSTSSKRHGHVNLLQKVDGATPLILALQYGRVECVDVLLRSGMASEQVASCDRLGMTPLMYAAGLGRVRCLELVLTHDPQSQVGVQIKTSGMTALMLAASEGHVGCVRRILQHSPQQQVLATNGDGMTALMLACIGGHVECVQLLLEHVPHVQVTMVDKHHWAAIMFASWNGRTNSIRALMQFAPEAQTMIWNGIGQTALMIAANKGFMGCVEQLLSVHAVRQLNAVDVWGSTAISFATVAGHSDCLRAMLRKMKGIQGTLLDHSLVIGCRAWCALRRQQHHTIADVQKCLVLLLEAGATHTKEVPECVECLSYIGRDLASRRRTTVTPPVSPFAACSVVTVVAS